MASGFHLTPAQSVVPYIPPAWCPLPAPPHGRLQLAHLPTPLYRIDTGHVSSTPFFTALKDLNAVLYIKRDDCTGGVETGGNKIRKLEFLLADALQKDCQAVVTIGGLQSNHCRATAAAARMVGLEPHLILRTPEEDVGMVGNVLIDRMVGSQIYTCTPGEYGRVGSLVLVQRLCAYLEQQQNEATFKVYPIPVGGSNAVGTWGYIHAVDELLQQWYGNPKDDAPSLDHIVFACGSGGTAAGIVLGMALAHGNNQGIDRPMPKLHAVGVCDDPDIFYRDIAEIANEMGFDVAKSDASTTEDYIRAHVVVHQGKGRGYAQSTPEELDFVSQFCRATGVALDPVYSGKALYHFWKNVLEQDPESFRNQSVLFWHTGGALGLYDKFEELASSTSLLQNSPCQRLDVYGKGTGGVDVSQ
jgi:D-cysteine desulfhydrase